MKLLKVLAKSVALAGLVGASAAGAATYSWTGGPGALGAGGTGGSSDALNGSNAMTFTYNENTQNLTVSARWFNTSSDGAPDGAWLVLSDGAMPSAAAGEVPIYYLDWGNGVNRISASEYDGSPYNGGAQFFGSWDNQITLGGCQVRTSSCTHDYRSISFTLNLANINAYDPNGAAAGIGNWKGGDFAQNLGVWFHWFDQNSTTGMTYTHVSNGYKVTGINTLSQSYYDTGGCGNPTTVTGTPTGGQAGNNVGGSSCNGGGGGVPVPAIPALLLGGLIGFGVLRRRAV
jgi:hypothetical protein